MGFSAALLIVGDELASGGWLDVKIDDDADPHTPNVTRWTAYVF